jgi:hypothetical protein
MTERFARGSVARLYFDLISSGIGLTGQTPVIAIQRKVDGQWFNRATGLFQVPPVSSPMFEVDAANLPGRYGFDFDHGKDLLGSTGFTVRKSNAGASPALAYDDIFFGPMPSVESPLLCSVQGTVFGADGRPLPNALAQATIVPVFTDGLGRAYEADSIVKTYTGADGAFDLPVPRGATVRLEIRATGYDRRALIPDQLSVLFTDL